MVASPPRPDRASLPQTLVPFGNAVQAALTSGQDLAQPVHEFCQAAFARPETAHAGSAFLLTTFARGLKRLAEIVPMEALACELAHGPGVLCSLIGAYWDRKGQAEQLAHLADAVLAFGPAAAYEGQKAEFIGALAASLAIQQPQRAEALLACAAPKAVEENKALFDETREWLNAGKLLVTATDSERSFWQQELRSRKRNWIWDTDEARTAVGKLKERHPDVAEGDETLIHRLVPSWAWNVAEPQASAPSNFEPEAVANVPSSGPMAEESDSGQDRRASAPSDPAAFPTASFAAAAASRVRLLPQRRRSSLLISGALIAAVVLAAGSWMMKSSGDTSSRHVASAVTSTRPLDTAVPLVETPVDTPAAGEATSPASLELASSDPAMRKAPSSGAPIKDATPLGSSSESTRTLPDVGGPQASAATSPTSSSELASSQPLTAIFSEIPPSGPDESAGTTKPAPAVLTEAATNDVTPPGTPSRPLLEPASTSTAAATEVAANTSPPPSPPTADVPPAASEAPTPGSSETVRAAQLVPIKRAKRPGWVETPFGIQFPVTPDNCKNGRITDPNGLVWQLPDDPQLTARVSGDHEVINPYTGARAALAGDQWSPGHVVLWAETGWTFKLPSSLTPTIEEKAEAPRTPALAQEKPKKAPATKVKANARPQTAGKKVASSPKSKRTTTPPPAAAKKSPAIQPVVLAAAPAPRASSSGDMLVGMQLHPDYAKASTAPHEVPAAPTQARSSSRTAADSPPASHSSRQTPARSFVTRSNNIRMKYKGGYWESEPGAYLAGAGESPDRWARDMTLKERSSGTISKDYAFEVLDSGIVRIVPVAPQ